MVITVDFHGWLTLLWQTVVFASLVFFLAVKARIMQASSNDWWPVLFLQVLLLSRNYVSMVKNPMFTQQQLPVLHSLSEWSRIRHLVSICSWKNPPRKRSTSQLKRQDDWVRCTALNGYFLLRRTWNTQEQYVRSLCWRYRVVVLCKYGDFVTF